jgi:hypothetical protein
LYNQMYKCLSYLWLPAHLPLLKSQSQSLTNYPAHWLADLLLRIGSNAQRERQLYLILCTLLHNRALAPGIHLCAQQLHCLRHSLLHIWSHTQ